MTRALVSVLSIVLFNSAALAQDPAVPRPLSEDEKKSVGDNRQYAWEVGVNAGGQLFRVQTDDQGLNNALHLDIRVGFRPLRPIGIELGLAFIPTGASDGSQSVLALNPHLDVNFDMLQFRVRPYLGLGFGGMLFTARTDPTYNLEGHFQAGLKVSIYKDLAVRAEAKVMFYPSINPSVHDRPYGYFANGIFTGGLMYSIGGKPYRVDRDGDGIFDEDDKCPDLPGEAKYDGCPPPVDSDGDGINDDKDQCPDVPGVEAFNGCPPPDKDGDGVTDDIDQCPEEPGPKENNGCPAVKLVDNQILTRQARFETNKADILPEYSEVLDALASFLTQHPEIEQLGVYGHTDVEGTRQRNAILSNERSESVVNYLVKKGVSKKRLIAKGFGQDKPIASNRTPEGKAKNRRVEFVVLKKAEAGVPSEPPPPVPPATPTPVEPAPDQTPEPSLAPTPLKSEAPAKEPVKEPAKPEAPAKAEATPAAAPAEGGRKPLNAPAEKSAEPTTPPPAPAPSEGARKPLNAPAVEKAPPAPTPAPEAKPEPKKEEKKEEKKDDKKKKSPEKKTEPAPETPPEQPKTEGSRRPLGQ